MIRSVDFASQAVAEEMPRSDSVAMISIATPGMSGPRLAAFPELLCLAFHDVEAVEEPWIDFDDGHARAILEFVARVHQRPEAFDLVVHCRAGISRSTAVALYVAEAVGCRFPRRQEAYEANLLVLKRMSDVSGVRLVRPGEGGACSGEDE